MENFHQGITITTVTHIPALEGYWAHSLEVLKLFFESLFASTELPIDLMVFDNNSCAEVQDYLLGQRQDGKIQTLILSEYNLKKLGAMDYLFATAPGEFVAFADSDVYFLPGWLERSLEILETFPEAAQVSALPTVDNTHRYMQSTLDGIAAATDLMVERGDALIPEPFIEAHRLSVGKSREDYLPPGSPRQDVRITRNGVSAFVSAQDFVFTTRKAVIRQVLPLEVRGPEEYYDPIYSPVFEAKTGELGYWRLSTTDYLAHHLGNQLPDLAAELPWLAAAPTGLPVRSGSRKAAPGWSARLRQNPTLRRWLKRLNTWTYRLLYEK